MNRTFDPVLVSLSVNTEIDDFVATEWLNDNKNIALTDGKGNVVLFQHEFPGVVQGHYFFNNARGKEAVHLSKEALEIIFNTYGIQSIFGLTPIHKKGALWLSKHLGFKSYGQVEASIGPCEMFVLSRKEYKWAA